MGPYVVVFVTAPSAKESQKIVVALVKEKLAACAGVLPGLQSHYRWKGKVESAREHLLIIKTRKSKLPSLMRRVRALHSYDVPEIIALPLLAGNKDYLRWIDASLT